MMDSETRLLNMMANPRAARDHKDKEILPQDPRKMGSNYFFLRVLEVAIHCILHLLNMVRMCHFFVRDNPHNKHQDCCIGMIQRPFLIYYST